MPQFGLKLTWTLALLAAPVAAQSRGGGPPVGGTIWPDTVPIVVDPGPVHQAPATTISAELLRYPLSDKARHMLQKAVRLADAGNHAGAVKQLRETLAKFPGTEAYAYSLIGVEYLKTDQYAEAVDALERAVALLPHDASNHANLGLALVMSGRDDRAEPELRRALELDPHYKTASQLLSLLALGRNGRKSAENITPEE